MFGGDIDGHHRDSCAYFCQTLPFHPLTPALLSFPPSYASRRHMILDVCVRSHPHHMADTAGYVEGGYGGGLKTTLRVGTWDADTIPFRVQSIL